MKVAMVSRLVSTSFALVLLVAGCGSEPGISCHHVDGGCVCTADDGPSSAPTCAASDFGDALCCAGEESCECQPLGCVLVALGCECGVLADPYAEIWPICVAVEPESKCCRDLDSCSCYRGTRACPPATRQVDGCTTAGLHCGADRPERVRRCDARGDSP
jgi:hypothetical protein